MGHTVAKMESLGFFFVADSFSSDVAPCGRGVAQRFLFVHLSDALVPSLCCFFYFYFTDTLVSKQTGKK